MSRGRHKTVEITGLQETMANLRALPGASQRAVLRPAVTKAASPVFRAAKDLAPVGDGRTPDGRKRPHMKRTIKKTRAKTYKRTGTVLIVLGPEKNKAPHTHLVSEGTQAHDIVLSKPAKLKNVILPKGTRIRHSGATPNPFMDNAGIAAGPQARAILEREIPVGIEKEAAKLAAKNKARGT